MQYSIKGEMMLQSNRRPRHINWFLAKRTYHILWATYYVHPQYFQFCFPQFLCRQQAAALALNIILSTKVIEREPWSECYKIIDTSKGKEGNLDNPVLNFMHLNRQWCDPSLHTISYSYNKADKHSHTLNYNNSHHHDTSKPPKGRAVKISYSYAGHLFSGQSNQPNRSNPQSSTHTAKHNHTDHSYGPTKPTITTKMVSIRNKQLGQIHTKGKKAVKY